jgi:hypothetical protein
MGVNICPSSPLLLSLLSLSNEQFVQAGDNAFAAPRHDIRDFIELLCTTLHVCPKGVYTFSTFQGTLDLLPSSMDHMLF